jgi:sugar lactone lactonase YvrE
VTESALPTVASEDAHQLAEGPVWDAPRRRLLWVDIHGRAIFEGQLNGDTIEVLAKHSFDGMVGAVAVSAEGALLVAEQETLTVIEPDGSRVPGPRIVPAGERRRCNDGNTDPAGRFLIGTLSLDETSRSTHETLSRVEFDGSLSCLDDDLTLSNGLAWSADGTRFYSIDTLRQIVFVRSYEPGSGEFGERQVHLEFTDGFPDGCAMDAEDHLWLAMWGLGEVRRYSPDGSLAATVPVPAPHTSAVAFAGEDLDVLVITTATSELTAERHHDNPDSGRLFTYRPGVRGLPISPWVPIAF